MEDLYVKLEHVQELMKLIKKRDSFHDWSDKWEICNRKVIAKMEFIEQNSISI